MLTSATDRNQSPASPSTGWSSILLRVAICVLTLTESSGRTVIWTAVVSWITAPLSSLFVAPVKNVVPRPA